jgi:hypothetical protein
MYEGDHRLMGGVDHCYSHNHPAKFRDLMYRVRHSAMIGQKTRVYALTQPEFLGCGNSLGNHNTVLHPVHQIMEFHRMTV